jgi:signal transduction histidine kinase/ligand-binding sensor domain-containing protein
MTARWRHLIRAASIAAFAASTATTVIGAIPSEEEPNFGVRRYGVEDGLPSDDVYAITQDQRGFLWVGTGAGLVRFDGQQFVRWGAQGEAGLPANDIRALVGARDGSVWVGLGLGGGVSRIFAGQVRNFAAEALAGGFISALAEDRDGRIWVGSRSGLAMFRGNHWEHIGTDRGLPRAAVHAVFEDSAGSFWVATAAGVYRRDPHSSQFQFLTKEVVRDFAPDRTDTVMVTGRHALASIGKGNVIRPALDIVGVAGETLLRDSQGTLWIGTQEHGLLRAPTEHGIQTVSHSLLAGETVNAMIEDRDGNKWVATSGGLFRLFHRRVEMAKLPDAKPLDVVSTEIGPDGAVWVGTTHGLIRTTTESRSAFTFARYVSGPVRTLWKAPAALWFGTSSSVGVVSGNRVVTAKAQPFGGVMALAARSPDDVWFCTAADGRLHRWYQGTLTAFDVGDNPSRACTAVFLDRQRNIWIGLDDGSLWLRRSDAEAPREIGRTGGRLCGIHEDATGTIWAASNAGLGQYRDGRFVTIGVRHGLPEQAVTGLQEDARGDLWLGMEHGIVLITKAEIQRALADSLHKVRYRIFDALDGLEGTPNCNGSPSSTVDPSGRVWFVTTRGLAVIDPAVPPRPIPTITTSIDNVIADDTEYSSETHDVKLRPRISKIAFRYSAVSISEGAKLRFQYKLEGFDPLWIDAGSRRQTFYTNLQPGSYRFVVRAILDGAEQPPVAWPFVLPAAYYETRGFYALSVIGIVVLAWASWRVRLRSVQRHFQLLVDERARIAREIHDTILQRMAGVALELEGLAMDGPSPHTTDGLRDMRRRIEETIGDARRSILDLRSTGLQTQRLGDALKEFAVRSSANGEPIVRVASSGEWRRYPSHVEDEFLRIGQEAIRNAVRHSRASQVDVLLSYERDALRLRVDDDGCGLEGTSDPTVAKEQWGLKGMQERISRIGGRLRITNKVGRGTEIEAWVSAH